MAHFMGHKPEKAFMLIGTLGDLEMEQLLRLANLANARF
jgi:hypothetical protein